MSEMPFDAILQAIITDYNNMAPARDTSQGSDCFIDAACQASALWGIYKFLDYVKKQISPLTCDSGYLSIHASKYGINRISGETDGALLARLLSRLQQPPAGGNSNDYIAWAKSRSIATRPNWAANHAYVVNDVVVGIDGGGISVGYLFICKVAGTSGAAAPTWETDPGDTTTDNAVTWQVWHAEPFMELVSLCNLFRHARGMGSLDLVIISNYQQIEWGNSLFTGTPSNALLADILAYIDEMGPVNAYDYAVLGPTNKSTVVTVTVSTGSTTSAQRDKIVSDIIAFMQGLAVGQTLYRSSLISICVNNGVADYSDIIPAADVPCYPDETHPAAFERIWPYDASGDCIVTVVEA